MRIPRGDGVALARALVRADSRNPSLVEGAPGERACARLLHDVLEEWGLRPTMQDAGGGRPNVVATTGTATQGAPSLMLNGHIDVVGIEGMAHPAFDAMETDGRLYGRGASDMKGGVAAMCAAAARVRDTPRGTLIVAAVVDEEWKSAGTRTLIERGIRADAAIVTEPTGLRIMPAHKGFVWLDVRVRGRAAHGSRWDLGVDAIRNAGLLLAELDRVDSRDLARRSHALLGRPSLHAGTIAGGTGLSTYPEHCLIQIERRTIPGESDDEARREIEGACARVRSARPEFDADVALTFSQPPSDVRPDAPIVTALATVLASRGMPTTLTGMSAWTDAALLNAAGIPAICFGPGDMALAHAAEEYIDVDEIERATDVLASLATSWCS